MKKLLLLLISVTLCIALVSCADTPCTEHVDQDLDGMCDVCCATVGPDDSEEGKTDNLVLIKDYQTAFAVVCASSLSDKSEEYVNDFVKNFNRYYLDDRGLVINYDAPGYDDATEIIFGSPSFRGDSFIKDAYYLGHQGFSIQVINNKLFVLAGGDDGYRNAIDYLLYELFDVESYKRGIIDNLTVPGDTMHERTTSSYPINEISIDGASISEFLLVYQWNSGPAKEAARILQQYVYENTGIRLDEADPSAVTDGQRMINVRIMEGDPHKITGRGFSIRVNDGDLLIECVFENKISTLVEHFLKSTFNKTTVSLAGDFIYEEEVRNIYYSEFGAVGDGVTDDFFAIKACHDYANLYGHTVNSDGPDKTYYIGNYLDKNDLPTSIVIQTDTNWHGCTFIFDDSVVTPGSPCWSSPIFLISPTYSSWGYSGNNVPAGSLMKGATDLGGWTPGVECLIYIENKNERHYIRYGLNANNGSSQHEIIYVHADGTIDPSTPLQWDYEVITSLTVYPCNEEHITVTGGDGDERATVKTIFNGARSLYNYYQRNFRITRSNVTLQNIDHIVEEEIPEREGGTGAPYSGFTQVQYANNVTIQNLLIHNLEGYHLETNKSNGMGTYEMSAGYSNNVLWKNVKQDVFFDADGGVSYKGLMGTNYCKNLTFDGNFVCSFDAHCGVYNGTIKNSTIEHLNFIGDGLITIENTTLYLDGSRTAIQLRSDYGSTWRGNVYMKDVDLKYEIRKNKTVSLVSSTWNNHDFGYTCYLPQDIYIENVRMLGFTVTVTDGIRDEQIVDVNKKKIYLFTSGTVYSYTTVDISDPNATMTKANDWKKCSCGHFNDTDGDGRCNTTVTGPSQQRVWCWGFEETPDKTVNANPYIGTKSVTVVNKDPSKPLNIVYPFTPQFKDLDVTVDGVLIIEDGVEVD